MNALIKILCDFSVSTVVYFLIGYPLAYGVSFLESAGSIGDGKIFIKPVEEVIRIRTSERGTEAI